MNDGQRSLVSARALESLLVHSPDHVFLVDAEYRVVYLNRPAGTASESGEGRPIDGFVQAGDGEQILSAIQTVFETHQPSSFEWTTAGDDDPEQIRHFHTRVSWVPVDDGPDLVSVVATDTTDRKRADSQGERQRRFLEAMDRINQVIVNSRSIHAMLGSCLEEMLDIFDCDRVWLLTPCDPAAPWYTVELERTRPAWPGAGGHKRRLPVTGFAKHLFEMVRSREGVHIFGPEHHSLDSEEPVVEAFGIRSQMVMEVKPKSGESWCLGLHNCAEARTYRWEANLFEAIARRLADALTGLLIEKNLKESEERFRTLVHHAPEAIVLFDVDAQRFLLANDQACQLFGYTEAELLQRGPVDVSPEFQADGAPSLQLAQVNIARALQGGAPVFEWLHQNSDGEAIPCEVRLVSMPYEGRQLVRGSMTDIRQRNAEAEEKRALAAQLLQAQKMEAIGQVTGGVAHDFNNLLTVILGNLELVSMDLTSEHPGRPLVDEASEAATRAAGLTHRLLAFARKQALNPRVVDINVLLGGIEGMLRRVIGEAVEIEVVRAGGLWPCQVDAAQLETAILNLAINARDAMPRGGKLTLETANARLDMDYAQERGEVTPGQYTLLVVTDNGVGMQPDTLARVFEPFFTTKGPGRGSGLGLSMVFGFVKQSGGHVQLYSEPGEGTSAKIYLPRSHGTASERTPAPPSTAAVGSGQTILVVEDEPAVLELAVRMLGQLGYRTVSTSDGPRALEVLESEQEVDLLFTDVVLPGGMNGADLARAAQKIRPDLPVLFTSGYTENAIIHNGRLDPGVELLEKPYTRSHLARSVAARLKTT